MLSVSSDGSWWLKRFSHGVEAGRARAAFSILGRIVVVETTFSWSGVRFLVCSFSILGRIVVVETGRHGNSHKLNRRTFSILGRIVVVETRHFRWQQRSMATFSILGRIVVVETPTPATGEDTRCESFSILGRIVVVETSRGCQREGTIKCNFQYPRTDRGG